MLEVNSAFLKVSQKFISEFPAAKVKMIIYGLHNYFQVKTHIVFVVIWF